MATPFPMPLTSEAIRQAAVLVQATWIEAVQSGRFFTTGGGAYLRGLHMPESLQWPVGGDELAALVQNVAAHAAIIEYGHAAFHLPAVVDWGRAKTKRSKAGQLYLRIPFRHAAFRTGAGITSQAHRTMLPQPVHAVASRLQPGQRLTAGPSRGRLVHAPGQQTSIFEGLRRQGAKGHSQYMTFRTMTPSSPGWNIPAQPGRFIARTIAHEVLPSVQSLIQQAAQQDVAAILEGLRTTLEKGGTP